jgi:hypothetical protein
MVLQWAILFALVFSLNNFLARKVEAGPMTRGPSTPSGGGS